MAKILNGTEVADKLSCDTSERCGILKMHGIKPELAIVRLGERPGDTAYINGAVKRAALVGVTVKTVNLDADISQEKLIGQLHRLNKDGSVHGVLLMMPLPEHMDRREVCEALAPEKDMDGITLGSMAGVYMDAPVGYPPCTADACMQMLKYYNVNLEGKMVTVVGRSHVIGKPAAMMAMKENATVTICHSKTKRENLVSALKAADVVIAAAGKARMIDAGMLGSGQIILDVGVSPDADGNLCGDVDFENVKNTAEMITPMQGGIGSVTGAILMKHVIEAAEKTEGGR